jgi:hypothetical protein
MSCGGSAKLADGISYVASSVVGPWGMMADGTSCIGGLTACSVTSTGWLADVGAAWGSAWTSVIFAVPQHLLRLYALLGPQQRLARGHRHLLVVEVEHLVRLPMYSFVATKQV